MITKLAYGFTPFFAHLTHSAIDVNDMTIADMYNGRTVKGEMVDVSTNPRLILSSTPTAITDPLFENYHIYSYDLSEDKIQALGNEMGQALGWFKVIDGESYLCSALDTVKVRLDLGLNPDLQNQLVEGTRYIFTCVFKVNEPWESDGKAAPERSFKAAKRKAMKAIAPKVHYGDNDYYTNYTIMPVSADVLTAIDNLDATKQVTKVSYVSTTGVVSDKPFQGVNIVITQFNDGSRIVTKAVK